MKLLIVLLLFAPFCLDAQVVFTGKVTDSEMIPLAGVSVVVKNSAKGTATDRLGNFAVALAEADSVVAFYFIGYESREILARNNRGNNTIVLTERPVSLDEKVIVCDHRAEITTRVKSGFIPLYYEGQSRYHRRPFRGKTPAIRMAEDEILQKAVY